MVRKKEMTVHHKLKVSHPDKFSGKKTERLREHRNLTIALSIHRLTPKKGVHQFRFFLPTMRTPNSIVVCSCMYAFSFKWDPMRTPRCDAYMHEQTTIGIHKEEVPKLVYTLFCCKPVYRSLYGLHDKFAHI